MTTMTIGQKIKQVRTEKGMSLGDLATISGITRSAISKYEKGLRQPMAASMYAIAKALDIPQKEIEQCLSINNKTKTPDKSDYSVHAVRLIKICKNMTDDGWKETIKLAKKIAAMPGYGLQAETNNKEE